MTEVYVVTRGSYSDYLIEAIYDNLEDAQWVSEQFNDANEVEIYTLNQNADLTRQGYRQWRVKIEKDGDANDAYDDVLLTQRQPIEVERFNHGKFIIINNIIAKDEEQAIKIAAEKWAIIMAAGLWDDAEKATQLLRS